MRLIGKDENFRDMCDFTGEVLIPLDYNTVVPLLEKKPYKTLSICDKSIEKLLDTFKKELSSKDKKGNLLILMRINTSSSDKASKVGHDISKMFSKDSLVIWSVQEYDKNRFNFYFYDN